MNWFKLVFAAALSVILIVSAIAAIFGAAKVVNATLETYILRVERCGFDVVPRVLEGDEGSDAKQQKERCAVDYEGAKRDIADGVSIFVVALPVTWIMYRKTDSLVNEIRS